MALPEFSTRSLINDSSIQTLKDGVLVVIWCTPGVNSWCTLRNFASIGPLSKRKENIASLATSPLKGFSLAVLPKPGSLNPGHGCDRRDTSLVLGAASFVVVRLLAAWD